VHGSPAYDRSTSSATWSKNALSSAAVCSSYAARRRWEKWDGGGVSDMRAPIIPSTWDNGWPTRLQFIRNLFTAQP